MSQLPTLSTEELDELERYIQLDLVSQGDLTCLLHSSQIEALEAYKNAPGSRFVLEVARRWGKTFLLLVIAFDVCFRKEKTRVVYGAPTLKNLQEFILPTFEKMREFFPAHMRPEFKTTTGHIICHNGSWIHLFGADDKRTADRGRGPEAALAVFDEAAFCRPGILKYVVRSIFRPSLLHSGGRTIIASTPAELPDHDFTLFAEKAEAAGAYFNRDVWSNPRLTEAQIEKFIQEDATDDGISVDAYIESDDFQREYCAKRVINRLLLGIPEWVAPWHDGKPYRDSHFVPLARPKVFRGHTIIDFGGNDPHGAQLAYWDVERGFCVERELLLNKDERSKLLSDEVKKLEEQTWGVKRWDGTLAALTTENLRHHFHHGEAGGTTVPDWLLHEVNKQAQPQPYLRICDVNVELARHLHSVGMAAVPVHKTEKQFMVQQLRNLIADGKYWVDSSCEATDRHLRTTTWANEKRKAWAHRGGEHGDLVDCSIYGALAMSRDVPAEVQAQPLRAVVFDSRPMSRLEARIHRARMRA